MLPLFGFEVSFFVLFILSSCSVVDGLSVMCSNRRFACPTAGLHANAYSRQRARGAANGWPSSRYPTRRALGHSSPTTSGLGGTYWLSLRRGATSRAMEPSQWAHCRLPGARPYPSLKSAWQLMRRCQPARPPSHVPVRASRFAQWFRGTYTCQATH